MRMSRRLGAGAIAVVSAAVAALVFARPGAAVAGEGPGVPPTAPAIGPRADASAVANIQTSGNWAGYNRLGGSGQFHSISGSWRVPTVQRHGSGNQFSSQWVGIGGGCSRCPSIVQAGSGQ